MDKKLAVFSHHRSGTHFLMKSLALNSHHVEDPELLIDVNLGADLWNPNTFAELIMALKAQDFPNIAKCHFEAQFVGPFIDKFLENFNIIYIVRRPEDALKSYYDFSKKLLWVEAPKTDSVDEFVKHMPMGSCLRWQFQQYQTMTHRWVGHVKGWCNLAEARPNIILVTYDDLRNRYQETMAYMASRLGWSHSDTYVKPEAVGLFPGQGGSHKESYQPDSLQWIDEVAGDVYRDAAKLATF